MTKTTFRRLPRYALQQLSAYTWQVLKDGKPHLMSGESNCREWLDKWARGEFETLPRKKEEED